MKRLLIAATLAFAFSATPAMAAPIPYEDDDASHWGAAYTLDLCGGEPCEFNASSTDSTITIHPANQTPTVFECTSQTVFYELEPNVDIFQAVDLDAEGLYCPPVYPRTHGTCVYSPSGFANGNADLEFWIRDDFTPPDGPGADLFAKASGGAIGQHVYQVESYDFDVQEFQGQGSSSTNVFTFEGAFDINGDPILFEHDQGNDACEFPELS
jgi:hypothetical protein